MSEDVTLTCVCGCGSIRFDYYDEEQCVFITPYALMNMDYPTIIPDSIWGRLKLAWRVFFGRYPEQIMIIDRSEWPQLHEFLHKAEVERDKPIFEEV